jgi:hypothetical protein
MKKLIIASAALGFALGMAAPAFAKFASVSTQGSSGKPAKSNDNQGTTTVTGPKGQVKQGKTANTSVDLPGNNR